MYREVKDVNRNNNKEIYGEMWKHVRRFKTTSPGNRWAFDLLNEAFERIDMDGVRSILDVGCGEGSKTYFLKNRFPQANVLGIDFAQSGIDAANSQYGGEQGLEFLVMDADNQIIWTKTYDLIFCSEVLEHIDDWKALVKEFAAAANKYIVLTFPTGRMRKYEINDGHVRNFKKGEMEGYLSICGFKPVVVYNAGFPFLNPIGRDVVSLLYNFYDNNLRKANQPTFVTELYSHVCYFLFKYCSTKYRFGDQFIGLFEKEKE